MRQQVFQNFLQWLVEGSELPIPAPVYMFGLFLKVPLLLRTGRERLVTALEEFALSSPVLLGLCATATALLAATALIISWNLG